MIKRCEVIVFVPVFITSEIVHRSRNETLLYIQSCLEKLKLKIYSYNIVILYQLPALKITYLKITKHVNYIVLLLLAT